MSKYIDVFNGDADGIFSLIQWRKSHPITANDQQILITGVKRQRCKASLRALPVVILL